MPIGLFGNDPVVIMITIGSTTMATIVTLSVFLGRLWTWTHTLGQDVPDKIEVGMPTGDPRMN